VLGELEKLSPGCADAVQTVRGASEGKTIRAAEKALGTTFLLTPGAAFRAGLTRQEEAAVSNLIREQGYEEPQSDG